MLQGIREFFSPDTKQQPKQQQQQKVIGQVKQQQVIGQNKQQQQVIGQQTKPTFIPSPPLKETSTLFAIPSQQLITSDQLSDAIIQQAKQQAQKSRKQLGQIKQQQQQLGQKRQAQQIVRIQQEKLEQTTKAHQQILGYVSQVRSLLEEIKTLRDTNVAQSQQSRNRLRQTRAEMTDLEEKLRDLHAQMTNARQQTNKTQKSHIRQLQGIKTTLLAQAEGLRPVQEKVNKKMIQYATPDGNKMRIQLSIHPDTKCCVAQSMAQKTRTHIRPQQKVVVL